MKLAPALCCMVLVVAGCGGTPVGNDTVSNPLVPGSPHAAAIPLKVTSPDLVAGVFPRDLTCDGANRAPQLEWGTAPPSTRSFAIEMLDPDAPGGIFVHWLVSGLPGGAQGLAGQLPAGAVSGITSSGKKSYDGPCPPAGPPHHYHIVVIALEVDTRLPPGFHRRELEYLTVDHVLGRGELVATYGR